MIPLVLEEFLVGLGYAVDEASSAKMAEGLASMEARAQSAGTQMQKFASTTAASIQKASSSLGNMYWFSQSTGAAVGSITALGNAMSQFGVSQEETNASLAGFTDYLKDNARASAYLNKLGVSDKFIKAHDTEGVLEQIIAKAANMTADQKQAYARQVAVNLNLDPRLVEAWLQPGFVEALRRSKEEIASLPVPLQESAERIAKFKSGLTEMGNSLSLTLETIGGRIANWLQPLLDELNKELKDHGGPEAPAANDSRYSDDDNQRAMHGLLHPYDSVKELLGLAVEDAKYRLDKYVPDEVERTEQDRSPGGIRASTPATVKDREVQAMDYLLKNFGKVLSKEEAAALIGQGVQESKLIPWADNGNNKGIFQLDQTRQKRFRDWSNGTRVEDASTEAQLSFAVRELLSTHKDAFTFMKSASDNLGRTHALTRWFEIPAKDPDSKEGQRQIAEEDQRRFGYMKDAYSNYERAVAAGDIHITQTNTFTFTGGGHDQQGVMRAAADGVQQGTTQALDGNAAANPSVRYRGRQKLVQ